ncbi:unnamed protein product [Pedinophyceae sp. YPF-701]|nr:unnamed protein product [Pedinophyceae sp. YPF-701]
MAGAMIGGFHASGTLTKDNVVAEGIATVPAAQEGGAQAIAEQCDVIFLAVKPFYMAPVLEALAPHIDTDRHLVVTVAAGIEIADYEDALPEGTRFVRVMPNTPCLVREGVCSYTLGTNATKEDGELMKRLLESVGFAAEVEERMIHGVIGVAGSCPAYLFVVLDALADGGVQAGLPRDLAQRMAAQTMLGAGKMMLEGGPGGSVGHPGVLKDAVTSPAGTTIEAVASLERNGVRSAFIEAVRTAAARSRAMADE